MNLKYIPFLIIFVLALAAGAFVAFGPGTHHGSQGPVTTPPPVVAPTPVPKPGPAKPTRPSAPPTQSNPKTVVQFGSFKTKAEASDAIRAATVKYGWLLQGRQLQIYKVVIKGVTWYRVVLELPPTDAAKVCQVAKQNGVDCLVLTFTS